MDIYGIVLVSTANETALQSLIDAKNRLNEQLALANAATEQEYDILLNTDPEEYSDIQDRIDAELKIEHAEMRAQECWKRYERQLVRYHWEEEQARKAGIIK